MKNNDDIRDDEIRIVGKKTSIVGKNKRHVIIATCCVVVVLGLIAIILCLNDDRSSDTVEGLYENEIEIEKDSIVTSKTYVKIEDIIINNDSLRIYTPVFSKVSLSLGPNDFKDSSIVFICQAADIRKDNYKILGDFVLNGEKLAFGHSKWGWCSIIDNEISLGCEREPLALEDAINRHGSFFRQFGLVVNGNYVKDTNNKKYCSIRRALCQKNGEIFIAESLSKVSLFTFAKLLESYGVDNAIALVGNDTYGFAIDENNKKHEFGILDSARIFESTSYVIFK